MYVVGYFSATSTGTTGTTTLTGQGTGGLDIFVAKLDANNGKPVWAQRIGAAGTSQDLPHDIAVDSSGNVLVMGLFEGTVSFGSTSAFDLTSAGNEDIFVAKLNSSGTFLWSVKVGGSNRDGNSGGIGTDSSGNVYITGDFESYNAKFGSFTLSTSGSTDIFLAKLNSSGTFQWANKVGSSTWENSRVITVDSSGNATIAGYIATTPVNFGTHQVSAANVGQKIDHYVAQADSSGTWNFATTSISSGQGSEHVMGIASDSLGNIYIVGSICAGAEFGTTMLNNSSQVGFLAKMDNTGTWKGAITIGSSSSDTPWDVTTDSSNNVHFVGKMSGSRTLGSITLTSNGGNDLYAAKLNSSLVYQSAFNGGGSGDENGYGVVVDGSGNIIVTGSSNSPTAKFGCNPFTLTAGASSDAIIWKQ